MAVYVQLAEEGAACCWYLIGCLRYLNQSIPIQLSVKQEDRESHWSS
jgi:hypothetical protein